MGLQVNQIHENSLNGIQKSIWLYKFKYHDEQQKYKSQHDNVEPTYLLPLSIEVCEDSSSRIVYIE